MTSNQNCEICGQQQARYVCQECGRKVCRTCFNPYIWACMQCTSKWIAEDREAEQHPTPLRTIWLGTLPNILILGFCIILIGAVLIFISAATGSSATGGAILFIGPLPIILGAEPEASTVTLISTLIAVAIILLLLVSYWKPRKIYA